MKLDNTFFDKLVDLIETDYYKQTDENISICQIEYELEKIAEWLFKKFKMEND